MCNKQQTITLFVRRRKNILSSNGLRNETIRNNATQYFYDMGKLEVAIKKLILYKSGDSNSDILRRKIALYSFAEIFLIMLLLVFSFFLFRLMVGWFLMKDDSMALKCRARVLSFFYAPKQKFYLKHYTPNWTKKNEAYACNSFY